MTRHDLDALKLATTAVGQEVALGSLKCRFIEYTSYIWSQRTPKPIDSRKEFTPHPRGRNSNVLLLFDRDIAYDLEGIPVRLSMTSHYTCGPCGFYAEVGGSIGDTAVRAQAILTGTVRSRDFIEPITVGNLIFHINYSINEFSLAVLKVKTDG